MHDYAADKNEIKLEKTDNKERKSRCEEYSYW